MKKINFILLAIFILTSCRSIDKMIESGNYDQALRFGVDKLRGEKNKKTKYVRGLEKAFAKLNNQDLNEINHLRQSGQRNRYDRIVDLYQGMEDRQNYVMPLLPLISKDGYLAKIKIVDYSTLISEAALKATEQHYTHATLLLDNAKRTGNKTEARNAYDSFSDVQLYHDDYKDTYRLKEEAYHLGQSRILVEAYTGGSNIAFDHTLDIISQVDIQRLNNKWEKFYIHDNGNLQYNYIATLEVQNILPGQERERVHTYTETKEIIDGQIPVIDHLGNTVTDTLGNVLYTDKFKEISAFVSEIQREKIAAMNGRLVIVDAVNNIHINTIPINITHEFRDYARTFKGDRRALADATFNQLKPHCLPFPSDYEITTIMAYSYKEAAEASLNNHRFRR